MKKILQDFDVSFYLIFPFYALMVVLTQKGVPIFGLVGAAIINLIAIFFMIFSPFRISFSNDVDETFGLALMSIFVVIIGFLLSAITSTIIFFGYALVFGNINFTVVVFIEKIVPIALSITPVLVIILNLKISKQKLNSKIARALVIRTGVAVFYFSSTAFFVFYLRSIFQDETGIFGQVVKQIMENGLGSATQYVPVIRYPDESWAYSDVYNFLYEFWLPFFGLSFCLSLLNSTVSVQQRK